MRFFRIVLSVYFVSLFTFFVISTFWVIPRMIHSQAEPDRILFPMDLACAVLTVVFGVAFSCAIKSHREGMGDCSEPVKSGDIGRGSSVLRACQWRK